MPTVNELLFPALQLLSDVVHDRYGVQWDLQAHPVELNQAGSFVLLQKIVAIIVNFKDVIINRLLPTYQDIVLEGKN